MSAAILQDRGHHAEIDCTIVDGEHGRVETRTSTVSTDIAWLQNRHGWPGSQAIGQVIGIGEMTGKTSTEIARARRGVENSLRRVLDVTMNEDRATNRKDHE